LKCWWSKRKKQVANGGWILKQVFLVQPNIADLKVHFMDIKDGQDILDQKTTQKNFNCKLS